MGSGRKIGFYYNRSEMEINDVESSKINFYTDDTVMAKLSFGVKLNDNINILDYGSLGKSYFGIEAGYLF